MNRITPPLIDQQKKTASPSHGDCLKKGRPFVESAATNGQIQIRSEGDTMQASGTEFRKCDLTSSDRLSRATNRIIESRNRMRALCGTFSPAETDFQKRNDGVSNIQNCQDTDRKPFSPLVLTGSENTAAVKDQTPTASAFVISGPRIHSDIPANAGKTSMKCPPPPPPPPPPPLQKANSATSMKVQTILHLTR